jgi:hypothetical protein
VPLAVQAPRAGEPPAYPTERYRTMSVLLLDGRSAGVAAFPQKQLCAGPDRGPTRRPQLVHLRSEISPARLLVTDAKQKPLRQGSDIGRLRQTRAGDPARCSRQALRRTRNRDDRFVQARDAARPYAARMDVEFIASIAVISPDPRKSRDLFIDALGLPLGRVRAATTSTVSGSRAASVSGCGRCRRLPRHVSARRTGRRIAPSHK